MSPSTVYLFLIVVIYFKHIYRYALNCTTHLVGKSDESSESGQVLTAFMLSCDVIVAKDRI